MLYNRNNFFRNTFCFFEEVWDCNMNKFNYHSKSGSSYHFSEAGVYRASNHWGRVGNCRWKLISKNSNRNGKQAVGFATWESFFENNEQQQIFFIDFLNGQYFYNHKNHSNYNEVFALFDANAAKKRVQTIAFIQTNASWAKYLEIDNTKANQAKAITKLRTENSSWISIKQDLSQFKNII